MNRRRAAIVLAASGVLALLGCAAVPRSITLSEAELQAQLARRFPLQRSVLELIDLQLSEPALQLDAASNRLSTELTLRAVERRLDGRSLHGRLALDYALRFEPSDASVRLVSPRVRSLQFDELPESWARRAGLLQQGGIALAERALDDLVLYRVPDKRLRALRAAGYRPGTLRVTPAGLEIGIEPLP
jgi:hypothetical protein